jgi:hypothetical protein
MTPSLPTSTLLLGLSLLVACDRAPEDASKAAAGEPASKAAEVELDAPKKDGSSVRPSAPADAPRGGVEPAPAVVESPAPVAEGTVVDGLSLVTHKVIAPQRTGDRKEDYWTQYHVWGEITNHSSEVMETVSGNITFLDASGAIIGIESIGSAIKQDLGDASPGETVRGAVHFVQPGQTVPFHFLRNLDAIKGDIASHRLTPRRGTPVSGPTPKGVAVDVKERFAGEGHQRKRMFEGTLRNDGEGGCRSPSLVVAFLDDAGKVADLESFDASDDLRKVLATGETIAVSGGAYVTGDDAWRETAKVRTYVDCQPIY